MNTWHPLMRAYLDYIKAQGRHSTIGALSHAMRNLMTVLAEREQDIIYTTAEDLLAVRAYLVSSAAGKHNKPLAKSTQSARFSFIKSFYQWLYDRRHISYNPAAEIKPIRHQVRRVQKDYLDQQEAQAFIETAFAALDERYPTEQKKNKYWARQYRLVVMVVIAIATGRRCAGVCRMRLDQLDLEEHELRVDWEKGKPGRVLPISEWACAIAADYIKNARPLIIKPGKEAYLFPGLRGPHIDDHAFNDYVKDLQKLTIKANPDLTDLARKRITTHSLRVSFAKLLFANGCSIRTLNELMLHTSLNTTARYTPLNVEEMRSVFQLAHPRA